MLTPPQCIFLVILSLSRYSSSLLPTLFLLSHALATFSSILCIVVTPLCYFFLFALPIFLSLFPSSIPLSLPLLHPYLSCLPLLSPPLMSTSYISLSLFPTSLSPPLSGQLCPSLTLVIPSNKPTDRRKSGQNMNLSSCSLLTRDSINSGPVGT